MIAFDAAHAAVHYPPDRRFHIWIRPSILIALALILALPVLAGGLRSFWSGYLTFRPCRRYRPAILTVRMASRSGCVTATSSTSFL